MVRHCRDAGVQTVCLRAEQPRGGASQFRVVEAQFAVHRGGQQLHPGIAQLRQGGVGVRGDDDRDGEDGTRRCPQALAVVRVDAVSGQDHRRGPHRVGDTDHGPGVARLTDAHRDRDQARRAGQHRIQLPDGRPAHRNQADWGHRVGQRLGGTFGDQVNRDARSLLGLHGPDVGQQRRVALRSRFGDEDLEHQPPPRRGLDQVDALDQEPLRPPAGDLPMQLDRRDHPGRAFGEHRQGSGGV